MRRAGQARRAVAARAQRACGASADRLSDAAEREWRGGPCAQRGHDESALVAVCFGEGHDDLRSGLSLSVQAR